MMVNPYLWEFLPFELGNSVRSFAFGFFKRMYWQPLNGYLYVPLVWGHWWNGKSIILEGSTCDLQGVRRVVTCHTYSRYVYCWSCWMILKVWVEVWFGLIVMVIQSTCNLLVKYSTHNHSIHLFCWSLKPCVSTSSIFTVLLRSRRLATGREISSSWSATWHGFQGSFQILTTFFVNDFFANLVKPIWQFGR